MLAHTHTHTHTAPTDASFLKSGAVRLNKEEILVVLSPRDSIDAWEQIVIDTMDFFPRGHELQKEHAGCEVMKLYDILVEMHPAVHVPQGSLCYQVEKGLLERLPAGSVVEVKCCYNKDGTIARTEDDSTVVDLLVEIKRAPGDDPQGPFLFGRGNPGTKMHPGMASSSGCAACGSGSCGGGGGASAASADDSVSSSSSSSSFSGFAAKKAQRGGGGGAAASAASADDSVSSSSSSSSFSGFAAKKAQGGGGGGAAASAASADAEASSSSSSSFSGFAAKEAQGSSSAGTAKVEQGGGVGVADAPSQLVRSNSSQYSKLKDSPIPKARIQLYKGPVHKRESSHAYSDETNAKKMKKDEDASRMPGDGGKNPVADPEKKIARAGNENAKPGLEADASVKRVDELEKKVAELTSKAASFQKREKEFNDDKERVYKFMLDRNSSRRGVESGTDDAGRSERDYDEIKEEVYKFMKERQSTRSASGAAVDA
jgi:hypothetical protein